MMIEEEKIADEEANRDRIELTKTEVLKAMNSVSVDLEFTMEICSDFEDNKLPTLSFSLYESEIGISHTYYEKAMKNQTLVMARSALSRHQLFNIMSNELIRRLEVISEDVDIGEKVRIVEQYTQQLVNSDYDWKFCREIIVSGLKGWKRKEARKQKLSIPRFRSGQSSLKTRSDRKLMEKYDWFKKKYNIEDDNDNDDSKVKNEKKSFNWKHYKRKHSLNYKNLVSFCSNVIQ